MRLKGVAVATYRLRFPFLLAGGKFAIGKRLYCEGLVAILEVVDPVAPFFGQFGGRLLVGRMQKISHFLLLIAGQFIPQVVRLLLAVPDTRLLVVLLLVEFA